MCLSFNCIFLSVSLLILSPERLHPEFSSVDPHMQVKQNHFFYRWSVRVYMQVCLFVVYQFGSIVMSTCLCLWIRVGDKRLVLCVMFSSHKFEPVSHPKLLWSARLCGELIANAGGEFGTDDIKLLQHGDETVCSLNTAQKKSDGYCGWICVDRESGS